MFDGLGSMEAIFFAVFILFFGGFALWVLIQMPRQAWARGHGFFAWLLLEILAINPVYPLILVSLLPNKARAKLREQYTAELDEKLVTKGD